MVKLGSLKIDQWFEYQNSVGIWILGRVTYQECYYARFVVIGSRLDDEEHTPCGHVNDELPRATLVFQMKTKFVRVENDIEQTIRECLITQLDSEDGLIQ